MEKTTKYNECILKHFATPAKKKSRKLQVGLVWKELKYTEILGNGEKSSTGEFQQQRKKKKSGVGMGDDSHVYAPSLLMHHCFLLGILGISLDLWFRHFLIWNKSAVNTWKADIGLPKGR